MGLCAHFTWRYPMNLRIIFGPMMLETSRAHACAARVRKLQKKLRDTSGTSVATKAERYRIMMDFDATLAWWDDSIAEIFIEKADPDKIFDSAVKKWNDCEVPGHASVPGFGHPLVGAVDVGSLDDPNDADALAWVIMLGCAADLDLVEV